MNVCVWGGGVVTFSELVLDVQEKFNAEGAETLFKMSDLSRIYDERLNIPSCAKGHDYVKLHTSRLRKRIEVHFRQFLSIKSGNEC